MSRHCMPRASNVWSALKVRTEVPQWPPSPMTLEAWRRGPHVPLDKGASLPWHGGVCPSMIMAPGHRGVVKDHLVWDFLPVTIQLHFAIVLWQRGVASEASQEAWAPGIQFNIYCQLMCSIQFNIKVSPNGSTYDMPQ